MSSAIKKLCWLLLLSALPASAVAPLRVCADPNSLPYSNQQQQGFENVLAEMVAHDLGTTVSYYWFPQRHKFFAKTLLAGQCDVVMEVPKNMQSVLTTEPYYRSSYVFVSPQSRNLRISSFDDPRLRNLRIGVHVTGENDDSLPPNAALLRRGLARNLVSFSIFGALSEQSPASDLIQAVADGAVDVAVVWGPLGGYFARHSSVPLDVTPVCTSTLDAGLPFGFDIAMGVRPGDTALRDQLNGVIVRHSAEIRQVLESYGVPLLNGAVPQCKQGGQR